VDKRVIPQINTLIGKDHYNHYRPANQLAKQGAKAADFKPSTLERFEALFKTINALF
jgi:hypothetical protein